MMRNTNSQIKTSLHKAHPERTIAQTVERARQIALILQLALLFLLLAMIFRTPRVKAAVNVKTAAYMRTEIDWVSENRRFQLIRTYNSRNLHLGIFGFGWCSNLELTIVRQMDGTLKVKDCNGDQEDIFRKRNSPVDTNPVYARPGTDEILMATDGQFFLKRGDKTDYFDGRGRWTGQRTPLDRWSLEYSGDLPSRLKINGQTLEFDPLYGNRRIQRIHDEEFEIHYQYSDQDLRLVRSPVESRSYRYDGLHNLIQIQSLEGETDLIQYDEKNDRVASVQNRRCREDYTYVTQASTFQTQILTHCRGRLPVQLNYQFNGRADQARLSFLKMESGRSKMIASYDNEEKLERTELLLGRKAVTVNFDASESPRLSKGFDSAVAAATLSALRIGSGGPL